MQAVDNFIEKHQLVHKGTTIVIGVSGGPDSMALLYYFLQKRRIWKLKVIAAHVNHGLRGKEAEEDYHYVESFCHKNDILFEGTQIDVDTYKKKQRLSTQIAARECRYHFFTQTMQKHTGDYLALAHHGDDQVETMLMRQVRGAFGRALAGIPVKREFAGGSLIRPFLPVSKQEIESYLSEAGIIPRRDISNDGDAYTRNRFRHALLPFLKKENPKLHLRFQQQSEAIQADEAYFSELAKEQLKKVTEKEADEEIILLIQPFQMMPIALQRRVIHLILNCLYPFIPDSLSSIHIEQMIQLCHSANPSGELHLPNGLYVIRSYGRVVISFHKREAANTDSFSFSLSAPSQLVLPNCHILRADITLTKPKIENNCHFFADAESVAFPLHIRSWQPGDRMTIKGMDGSKKIKDIFIDEKVDRSKRLLIPVVEDAEGRILWLAGLKKSQIAAISEQTVKLLHLSYHKSTGNHREGFQQHEK